MRILPLLVATALLPHRRAAAQSLDPATLQSFQWRAIGPVNMGGRISDVEGIPGNGKVFYLAAATGGIWKTVNAGTTFTPLFDHEKTVSLGDLAIAPSNPDIIWAGTGEQNSRNSVSPGAGVYKSTDGGKSWKLMGLEKTQHIGRIAIHPTNPDIVYVAALGALWTSNPERGLYQTTDGGATWRLSKFISDKAGFVDVALDPRNPDVLYASSYERVRKVYALKSGGPGSALWKSSDGGRSWTEIKGGGFPETTKGRITLALAPSNPDVIYAQVEADSIKGATPQRLLSGLYRSADAGKTWTWMSTANYRPFYFSEIRVDPRDPNRVYRLAQSSHFSEDGGATWREGLLGLHEDSHAMWIDPRDPDHFIIGNDAGIFQSWDKGGTYDVLNQMPLAQFYGISFDYSVPYRVCGGMQDNGTSCGPSRKRLAPLAISDWFALQAADGFWTAQDPRDPNIVYLETQGGNLRRRNLLTGENISIKPRSITLGSFGRAIAQIRGDLSKPVTPEQQQRIDSVKARLAAELADPNTASRWNWNTPMLLSVHDPLVFYSAAEKVFKSVKRGENPVAISGDLSRRDPERIAIANGFQLNGDPAPWSSGGITSDIEWLAEQNGTVVALAESPIRAGLLAAGTDDGNVWLTRNDGAAWEDLTGRFPGVPARSYVSRIELSHFDSATVYVTFDNHREGDFAPYAYRSTDFGKTFRSIASDLPRDRPGHIYVLREDPVNRDLLYVGTDRGVWFSRDRGGSWQELGNNLPTVPVYDLKIHPRDRELIAGTHGRGIWIMDVAPLQQLDATVAAKPVHLFAPTVAFQYYETPSGSQPRGNRGWRGEPGPWGADLAVKTDGAATGTLLITNAAGDTLSRFSVAARPGIQHFLWNFQQGPAPGFAGGGGFGGGRGGLADPTNPRPAESTNPPDSSSNPAYQARMAAAGRGVGGGGRGGGGGGGGFGGGQGQGLGPAPTGEYQVILTVGTLVERQRLRVVKLEDPKAVVLP